MLSVKTDLRPPVVPFYPFLGEGFPIKIDYSKKGTLILPSLLEDLEEEEAEFRSTCTVLEIKFVELPRKHE